MPEARRAKGGRQKKHQDSEMLTRHFFFSCTLMSVNLKDISLAFPSGTE